jgi:Fe-S cluster biogenesis protein NfuA
LAGRSKGGKPSSRRALRGGDMGTDLALPELSPPRLASCGQGAAKSVVTSASHGKGLRAWGLLQPRGVIMAVSEANEVRIKEILEQLRPYLQSDGGDLAYSHIADDVVYIELHGACQGCASSLMTLKLGIERRIMEEIPEVKAVEVV